LEENKQNIFQKTSNYFNKWKLDEFQKEIPRKMTLHILSNNRDICVLFIEFLTNEKLIDGSNELLEKQIIKKLNLFSFMNYKIYTKASELMKSIIQVIINDKKNLAPDSPIKSTYSEVVIIIDNSDIKEQIEEIKHTINMEDNLNLKQEYYCPFFLIISPKELDLKGFIKTYQYNINLENIINTPKNEEEEMNIFFEIINKISKLFVYYNELGDEFYFINSQGKEILIKTVDDSNIPIFINILILGITGVGKSKLINLILDDKKSLEGGYGFSTTSKNIITYRKDKIPIRLFDAKGMEVYGSLENYLNLLTKLNGNLKASNDQLNAIFYCIKFSTGTVLYEPETKVFEKIIDFNVPIIFIITFTEFDVNKNAEDSDEENEMNTKINTIKNAINNSLKSALKKKLISEIKIDDYIHKYTSIHFVNLVKKAAPKVPVFGIDEALSFFTNLVPKNNWDELIQVCKERDEEKYKVVSKNNIFINSFIEFDKIKERNKIIALNYLDNLKKKAIFTGAIPFLDIGMEYHYRNKFLNRLKSLYGFDYEKAENIRNSFNINRENNKNTPYRSSKSGRNINKLEKKIENIIDEGITNKVRNTVSILGRVVILKSLNVICLPLTFVFGSVYSYINIDSDCLKILDIFEEAFTPLKFESLMLYIKALLKAIEYLDNIGKKIVEEGNKTKSKKINNK